VALLAELMLFALWARSLVLCLLAVRFHLAARAEAGAGPGVSVVIPAFQEEDQIGATLAALGAGAAEIVVVDDGSTDMTGARAKAALAGRAGAQVLRLGLNRGKAAALNAGLARAGLHLVLTLDADTRLAPGALDCAVTCLRRSGAAAVALDLAVERPATLLQRLQAQEYAAALGFERAGQAAAGIVSILPGAATLFRAEALGAAPFSDRTETEDADLTLTLARRGAHMTLASSARAETDAPREQRALLRQRRRWIRGHLQCCRLYSPALLRPAHPGFLATLNFATGTLAPLLMQAAMLMLVLDGAGPLTGLGWAGAMLITAGLVIAQRLVARGVGQARGGVGVFLMEPVYSALLGSLALYAALGELLLRAPAHRPRRRWS
jgi:biofilm PGA synthesis N-glycosyltransferase PgaC